MCGMIDMCHEAVSSSLAFFSAWASSTLSSAFRLAAAVAVESPLASTFFFFFFTSPVKSCTSDCLMAAAVDPALSSWSSALATNAGADSVGSLGDVLSSSTYHGKMKRNDRARLAGGCNRREAAKSRKY